MTLVSLDLNAPLGQCQIQDTKKKIHIYVFIYTQKPYITFVHYKNPDRNHLIASGYILSLPTTQKKFKSHDVPWHEMHSPSNREVEITEIIHLKPKFYSGTFYMQQHLDETYQTG